RGARRYAADVRVDERISKERLEHDAGDAETGADARRHADARQPQIPENRMGETGNAGVERRVRQLAEGNADGSERERSARGDGDENCESRKRERTRVARASHAGRST